MLSFLAALPHILRQRQVIQKRKRISNQTLQTMLSDGLGEPSLSHILKTRLRWG
jgi:hypothetical protein